MVSTPKDDKDNRGFGLRRLIKSPEPITVKFEKARRILTTQITKQEIILQRLKNMEQGNFSKVVWYLNRNDRSRAAIYSNEVAHIRQMIKTISQTKTALLQISIRLETAEHIKDMSLGISKTLKTIRELNVGLDPQEIGEIGTLFADIASDVGYESKTDQIEETPSETVISEAENLIDENITRKINLETDEEDENPEFEAVPG